MDAPLVLATLTLLAAASALVLLRQRRDGRFRDVAPAFLSGAELGHRLGERATFVQFSSAVCATCPQVRRVLSAVAAAHPGVTHVEVSSEDHPDLVRRLGVLRTPTVLLLDGSGAITSRTAGALRPEQATAALVQR